MVSMFAQLRLIPGAPDTNCGSGEAGPKISLSFRDCCQARDEWELFIHFCPRRNYPEVRISGDFLFLWDPVHKPCDR